MGKITNSDPRCKEIKQIRDLLKPPQESSIISFKDGKGQEWRLAILYDIRFESYEYAYVICVYPKGVPASGDHFINCPYSGGRTGAGYSPADARSFRRNSYREYKYWWDEVWSRNDIRKDPR